MLNRISVREAKALGLLGRGARFGFKGRAVHAAGWVDRRRNKWGVAPKKERTLDGVVFASKHEMQVYAKRQQEERIGAIRNLRRQVKIPVEANGVVVCTVVLDIVYERVHTGATVYEDAKGKQTRECAIKYRLFEAITGNRIVLV